MSVKVLIKRKVPKDLAASLTPLLKELRMATMGQAGYISGETMDRIDRPGETLVISTWQSMDEWMKWVMNSQRIAIQDKIDLLLGEETIYEIYQYS